MKKILVYIGIVLLILGSFMTVLIFNKSDINDSVVYIECMNEVSSVRSGTGFVYKVDSDKNYIVTSYHVIEGYNDIYVYNSDKKKIKASVLNYDEYTDIAILIIQDRLDLNQAKIGNSSKIKTEDRVIAIGNLDLENINRKSKGKIIDNQKKITIQTTHGSSNLNVIELDIDVTYGNSGGPLLNNNNEVIGMMFTKEENKNIAYALSIDFVLDIVIQLESGSLKRPNLGSTMCNSTNTELLKEYGIDINEIEGVVLLELNELGLLHKFGMKKGDIITDFNGIGVKNVNKFREELYKKEKGDIVEIGYYRNKIYYKIQVEL